MEKNIKSEICRRYLSCHIWNTRIFKWYYCRIRKLSDNSGLRINLTTTNTVWISNKKNFLIMKNNTKIDIIGILCIMLYKYICRFWMLPVNENEYICFLSLKMNNFCSCLAYISYFDWIFPVPNLSFTFYKCAIHIIDVWISYFSFFCKRLK